MKKFTILVFGLVHLLLIFVQYSCQKDPQILRKIRLIRGQPLLGSMNCPCSAIYMPVCGSDDKTYPNACAAKCNVAVSFFSSLFCWKISSYYQKWAILGAEKRPTFVIICFQCWLPGHLLHISKWQMSGSYLFEVFVLPWQGTNLSLNCLFQAVKCHNKCPCDANQNAAQAHSESHFQ